MSRYCASCGKLLADDAKFCTSCGAPVEQAAASDGQPAFEQTGALDTSQTKSNDPVAGGSPQQQPASAYTPASLQAPAPKKSGTGPLIAVIVVLVAIIIALVIFFVIKPFDNAATQTTAEVAKLHHDDDADDLKPFGDPNSLYDDLDHRIDAICDAWEISLKYSKPEDHKDEIVAPLARDNEPGTSSNKYRLDFEDRYPGAKPVEVN